MNFDWLDQKLRRLFTNVKLPRKTYPKKVYYGLTERTFKERYNEHKSSFNNERYKNSNTLSTHIWDVKSKDVIPTLKWSIVFQTKAAFRPTCICNLVFAHKGFTINGFSIVFSVMTFQGIVFLESSLKRRFIQVQLWQI